MLRALFGVDGSKGGMQKKTRRGERHQHVQKMGETVL